MYLRYYEYGRLVNQGWIFDTVANNMRLTKNVADFEVVYKVDREIRQLYLTKSESVFFNIS